VNIISDPQDITVQWNGYFDDLLNKNINIEQTNEENQDIQQLSLNDDEDLEVPTYQEITRSIKKLKNYMASGTDGIPAALLKYGGIELTKRIHQIIQRIWIEEKMPEEWNQGILCPILKKGDPLICSNYRGISLLKRAYQILPYILYNPLLDNTEQILGENQCEFHPRKSTINLIFTLSQIIEKTVEFQIGIHHLFIDFKAAYDSINHKRLYSAMEEFGIPRKLIKPVQMTMAKV
jgi:hypothetical protein